MKRCPTCNKQYTDENLSFCTDDGTPLVREAAPTPDPEATLVSPSWPVAPSESGDETKAESGVGSESSSPAYQPPQSIMSPAPRKRSALPWILGILALLFIGVVGLGIVAAIVIPRIMSDANSNRPTIRANLNANLNSNLNAPSNSNTNSDTNSNTNSNPGANTNSNANGNLNSNLNTNSNGNSGSLSNAPTDHDLVLSQLTDLENDWTVANINADKKALAKILADDYVGISDGRMQGKAEYLRDIKPDRSIRHWNLSDLTLTLADDRATLKGKVSFEVVGQDKELVLDFTDKFVWRDGRWQAVSSDVSSVK